MPTYIIKLTDPKTKTPYYMEWSTVSDRPITNGMDLFKFRKYYIKNYGISSMQELNERLERVEKQGCSSLGNYEDLDFLIRTNRAGENESCLSLEQIIEQYCK